MFECRKCGLEYAQAQDLISHNCSNKLICYVCNKEFDYFSFFKRHIDYCKKQKKINNYLQDEDNIQSKLAQLDELTKENKELKASNDYLKKVNNTYEDKIKEQQKFSTNCSQIETELASLKANYNTLEKEKENLEKEKENLEKEKENLEIEIRVLKNVIEMQQNKLINCKNMNFTFMFTDNKGEKHEFKTETKDTNKEEIKQALRCNKCEKIKDGSEFYKNSKICKQCFNCEHGKRKEICKDCGGSQICKHDKRKEHCIDCGGSQICEHKKVKYTCKECGGSQICEHKKNKNFCIECKGRMICEHKKNKYSCIECGGSYICEHKKNKYSCIECGGSQICEHKKRKINCLVCNPHIGCKECQLVIVNKSSLCHPYCEACFCNLFPNHEKSRLYKTKERVLRDELRKRFENDDIDFIFDKAVDGGCSKRKPDVLIECFTHSIIVECDEFQHKNYECENKRMMQLFIDLGSRPIVFIRFNPDSYIDKDGKKVEGCFKALIKEEDLNKKRYFDINFKEWNKRVDVLESEICTYFEVDSFPEKEVTEIKLFYDGY